MEEDQLVAAILPGGAHGVGEVAHDGPDVVCRKGAQHGGHRGMRAEVVLRHGVAGLGHGVSVGA